MKKYILIASGLVLAGIALLSGHSAQGNAFFVLPLTSSATATSSLSYVSTSGTTASATTTFDAYSNGSPRLANFATILSQYVASSTSSVWNLRVEYSQDGIDWYSDFVNIATTSTAVSLAQNAQFTYTAVSTATTTKAVRVATPTRFMRVVYNISGANGSVWTQIVPTREVIN